jgi:eukaryotic-like serine/threonine-protein kinase
MTHHAGDVLGGRYRLDDRIASGGIGEVWQGTDTVLRRAIALKTLLPDRATDPQFRSRFEHEARTMAALHHPGIADVYDFGQDPGNDAYLVMARVSGQPLSLRIAERGRLDAAGTMSIVAQVGRALQAAHEAGIVHRDVKPGNIIIQPDGQAVLVDFGVARSADSAALTGAEEVVGTAEYIAPEQVAKRAIGPATDVYALGAVAYHCLAGHPPFFGGSPVVIALQHLKLEAPALPADVPPRVRSVVATALAKEPADRFPSAAAMASAAELAAASADTTDTQPLPRTDYPGPTPRAPAGRGRRRLLVVALVAALTALLGAAFALADPFDLMPGPPASPAPASAGPSSVTSSPLHSPTGAPGGGADAGNRTPTPSAATTSRSPSPSPSTSPSSPVPGQTPPTTTPTGRQTTGSPPSPSLGTTSGSS